MWHAQVVDAVEHDSESPRPEAGHHSESYVLEIQVVDQNGDQVQKGQDLVPGNNMDSIVCKRKCG